MNNDTSYKISIISLIVAIANILICGYLYNNGYAISEGDGFYLYTVISTFALLFGVFFGLIKELFD